MSLRCPCTQKKLQFGITYLWEGMLSWLPCRSSWKHVYWGIILHMKELRPQRLKVFNFCYDNGLFGCNPHFFVCWSCLCCLCSFCFLMMMTMTASEFNTSIQSHVSMSWMMKQEPGRWNSIHLHRPSYSNVLHDSHTLLESCQCVSEIFWVFLHFLHFLAETLEPITDAMGPWVHVSGNDMREAAEQKSPATVTTKRPCTERSGNLQFPIFMAFLHGSMLCEQIAKRCRMSVCRSRS